MGGQHGVGNGGRTTGSPIESFFSDSASTVQALTFLLVIFISVLLNRYGCLGSSHKSRKAELRFMLADVGGECTTQL